MILEVPSHLVFYGSLNKNFQQLRSGGELSVIFTAANGTYLSSVAHATVRVDGHTPHNSSQLTAKLPGGTLSVFSTYIRDVVRNAVACVLGSKSLCLFRHFYLLERRKITRSYGTGTLCSPTLWIRLLQRCCFSIQTLHSSV